MESFHFIPAFYLLSKLYFELTEQQDHSTRGVLEGVNPINKVTEGAIFD